MIFFFCGAQKHASHFQMFIVTEALRQKGREFAKIEDGRFHYRELDTGLKALKRNDFREGVQVAKGHWGTKAERDTLLSIKNIRIFLIWRDIRDVLVSTYFYEMRRYGKTFKNFEEYYWGEGRGILFYHMAYRKIWDAVNEPDKVFHSSFTELKTNFNSAAEGLLRFAGIEDVDLEALHQQVSVNRLRKTIQDDKGVLIRKGQVGEHAEVIQSEKIYEDIERIQQMSLNGLYLSAFRHNPKVVGHHYYPMPGKGLIRSAAVVYRSIRPKREKGKEKPKNRWWYTQ